jgi:hypothetical protein
MQVRTCSTMLAQAKAMIWLCVDGMPAASTTGYLRSAAGHCKSRHRADEHVRDVGCCGTPPRSPHKPSASQVAAGRSTLTSRFRNLLNTASQVAETLRKSGPRHLTMPGCAVANQQRGAGLHIHVRTCIATHPQKLLQLIPAALVIQQSATPKDVKGRHQGNIS